MTHNPEFTLEVMRLINDENLSFLPNSNVLCHVRRGDYTSTDYYGLLTDEYYRNFLLTIENAHAPVISDDQNAGKRVAKAIDGEFLKTSSVSPFVLLGLMHRHKVVVGANSSLSWWCGFLCRFDRGRHLIPTPWLKNTSDEGRWLHYIGCEDVTSIFEK